MYCRFICFIAKYESTPQQTEFSILYFNWTSASTFLLLHIDCMFLQVMCFSFISIFSGVKHCSFPIWDQKSAAIHLSLGGSDWFSFYSPSACTRVWSVSDASKATVAVPFTTSASLSPSMLCCSAVGAGGCGRESPSISTCTSWATASPPKGSSPDCGCNCWANSYLSVAEKQHAHSSTYWCLAVSEWAEEFQESVSIQLTPWPKLPENYSEPKITSIVLQNYNFLHLQTLYPTFHHIGRQPEQQTCVSSCAFCSWAMTWRSSGSRDTCTASGRCEWSCGAAGCRWWWKWCRTWGTCKLSSPSESGCEPWAPLRRQSPCCTARTWRVFLQCGTCGDKDGETMNNSRNDCFFSLVFS